MNWSNLTKFLLNPILNGKKPERNSVRLNQVIQNKSKLTRKDILTLIEENGGPKGLDFSGCDLSWLDLGQEAIVREAQTTTSRKFIKVLPWQNENTGGINLRDADFTKANLTGTNLAYANLKRANFECAILNYASLTRARLDDANFSNADLSGSDLSGAYAFRANFDQADLSITNLTGADFDRSSLKRASIYKAYLSGTKITRRELSDRILQENSEALVAFLRQHHSEWINRPGTVKHLLQTRQLEEARQVYSNLKANFLETGNFDDAGWAHIKERQMTRMMNGPRNARYYFSDETEDKSSISNLNWWSFHLSHTLKWLFDWISEISCGYGERPLRVAWLSIVIVIGFVPLYKLSGGIIETDGTLSWLDYLNYSLGAFTTIGFDKLQANTPIAQTLTSFEAMLGISMLALLMFTLGNRISRS